MPLWPFSLPSNTPAHDAASPESTSKTEEHSDTDKPRAELPDGALISSNAPDSANISPPEHEEKALQTGQGAATTIESAHKLRRRYADLLRSRAEMANTRLEAQQALQQSNASRQWFRESQSKLMRHIREKCAGDFDQDTFLDLCSEAIADSEVADAHAVTASVLQGRLSSLDYRMSDIEDVWFEGLILFLKATGPWEGAELDSICARDGVPTTLHQSPALAINPLLQSYYSKAGDVGLLGEEIADLDIEYQEARRLRTLKSDQGSPPSQSEEFYEAQYRTSRAAVEKRLADAIEAAEYAKRQCLVANLDPQASLADDFIDGFALPEPLLVPRSGQKHGHLDQLRAVAVTDSQPSAEERNQAMVLEWASHLPAEPQWPMQSATMEAIDGKIPVARVTREEVDSMHRIDLNNWGYQHVQRPRRHSSTSHLRWKGNESHKMLTIGDESK